MDGWMLYMTLFSISRFFSLLIDAFHSEVFLVIVFLGALELFLLGSLDEIDLEKTFVDLGNGNAKLGCGLLLFFPPPIFLCLRVAVSCVIMRVFIF